MYEHPIDQLFDSAKAQAKQDSLSDNEWHEPVSNIEDLDDKTLIPILPLRDNVLFPDTILPITATRKSSQRLLKMANRKNLLIGVVAQREDTENPSSIDDVYQIGCIGRVVHIIDTDDNKDLMVVIEGKETFELASIQQKEPFLLGTIKQLIEEESDSFHGREVVAKMAELRQKATIVSKGPEKRPTPSLKGLKGKVLLNFLCCHTTASINKKQQWLTESDLQKRLDLLLDHFDGRLAELKVVEEIESKTRREMDRQQREYMLNQQMNVIQKELGGGIVQQDIDQLRSRSYKKDWSNKVLDYFNAELNKLSRINPQQPEYTIQLGYLKLFLDLPWDAKTYDNLDINHARMILDQDHFGLEKVKERIIEYLAVLNLKHDFKSPILCLVGPPGTGKTSLGKSIARALGRKYVRVALGGVNDESEIRGHRRTYVSAMPGRIIQNIKRAGTRNPVFVLDEIDKVQTQTHNGDPTSALLEVLDPEQNNAFHDNFLDFDYDLSHVMFIATANDLNSIQRPLLDRMEIINLSGYVMEEKLEIAKRYIIPRQMKELGLTSRKFTFSDAVLQQIINEYTREAGVRQLDHTIAKVIRHKAVQMVSGEKVKSAVKGDELRKILGLPIRHDSVEGLSPRVGVVTGLAWTQVGGEILFVEASKAKGKGTLTMTGNLGDVMKESATLAFEYIKAHCEQLEVDATMLDEINIHVHVPEGATPKDGPSAGITMFTAMYSILTGKAIRSDYAMTGEITLRGQVTAVGGIREKILAAKAAGVKHIVLSHENQRDIEEIPSSYIEGLDFIYIHEMSEVVPIVCVDNKEQNEQKEKKKSSRAVKKTKK